MQYMDLDPGTGPGSREREERIGPREGQLIKYRDSRTPLVFHLVGGETISGLVRWFDHSSVCVLRDDQSEATVMNIALAYYAPKSSG